MAPAYLHLFPTTHFESLQPQNNIALSTMEEMTANAVKLPANMETIAAEIMAALLKESADLASLHRTLLASPNAHRVFETYGLSILESVIRKTVPYDIACIIRIICFIRRSDPSEPISPGLTDFLGRFVYCQAPFPDFHPEDKDFHPERAAGPPIDACPYNDEDGTDAYSGTDILLLARNIAILGDMCIDYYRRRCASTAPVNDTMVCTCSPPDDPIVRAVLNPVNMYQPRDYGPASWTEMQRALRGLWRLQLHYEVVMGARAMRFGWSPFEINMLDNLPAEDFFRGWETQFDEFYASYRFLSMSASEDYDNLNENQVWFDKDMLGDLAQVKLGRALEWPTTARRPASNYVDNSDGRIKAPPNARWYTELIHDTRDPRFEPCVPFWIWRELGFAY